MADVFALSLRRGLGGAGLLPGRLTGNIFRPALQLGQSHRLSLAPLLPQFCSYTIVQLEQRCGERAAAAAGAQIHKHPFTHAGMRPNLLDTDRHTHPVRVFYIVGMHALTHGHTCTHTHFLSPLTKHTHAHKHFLSVTHMHPCTHAHTRTHTHTHTHTQVWC